jgi:hypothetical protein
LWLSLRSSPGRADDLDLSRLWLLGLGEVNLGTPFS